MRTHKRRLPICAAVLRRGQERTQNVLEPQENARNIPATPISCQGKNVCRLEKRALCKKQFAPGIVYGLRGSGANGLVEIARLLQLVLRILCPSWSVVRLCRRRNRRFRWRHNLLSVRFLGWCVDWIYHTFDVRRRRLRHQLMRWRRRCGGV